jgi:hypothetical protein
LCFLSTMNNLHCPPNRFSQNIWQVSSSSSLIVSNKPASSNEHLSTVNERQSEIHKMLPRANSLAWSSQSSLALERSLAYRKHWSSLEIFCHKRSNVCCRDNSVQLICRSSHRKDKHIENITTTVKSKVLPFSGVDVDVATKADDKLAKMATEVTARNIFKKIQRKHDRCFVFLILIFFKENREYFIINNEDVWSDCNYLYNNLSCSNYNCNNS